MTQIKPNIPKSSGRLEIAEANHKRILAYLVSLKDKTAEPNIAVAYHQLGRIAQERQQLD